MTGRARQMHFSNAYALVNLGIGRPKVKLCQYVVPFGTLAEYDTHGIVLQTPYARTLGIRLDRGIAVEGSSSGYDYWLSLSGGDGRGSFRGGHAAVARVAWTATSATTSCAPVSRCWRGATCPSSRPTRWPCPWAWTRW